MVNHFTAWFLPWHRKYQLEYENVFRAQSFEPNTPWRGGDEDPCTPGPDDPTCCPGCRIYHSCVTAPVWDWSTDQSECETVVSGGSEGPFYKADTATSSTKKAPATRPHT